MCVGHAVQDFVFSLPTLPDRGAKYRAERFDAVGGGPAATAAVTVARLGGRASLAARVGADAIADTIAKELEHHAVDCRYLRRFEGCGSSLSAVMVDRAGERMIVNYLDERIPAGADWLPDAATIGAQAVLADTRWPEGAQRALESARAAGIPAVLDADCPVPAGGALLRAATHVAFSAEGLAELANDDDPERALRAIAAATRAWCCVTLGADGVLIIDGDRVARQKAFQVPVVDTLGAGDVWHGAFALALAEGSDASRACRFASAAAAIKVQRRGGRAGVPSRPEVEALLATDS
jgi:sulfofructose kinase